MKSSAVKKLLPRLRNHMGLLILALLSAVVSISLTLLIPVLVGKAIDNIIAEGQVYFEAVTQIILYIAIAIIGVTTCQWLMNFLVNLISFRLVRDLRRDVFRKFNTVPLSAIDTNSHGDLISRVINDVDAVGDGLTQLILQLFSGVVTIIGTLGFMIAIDWKIAIAVFLLTPMSLFLAAFIGRLTHRRFTAQQILQGEISSYVEEHVGNQRLVKAFSFEKRAFEGFDKYNEELHVVGFKAQFAGALANPSTRFVNALVYAAVGVFGAVTVISGGLSIGGLSCFLTYANQYTKPFNEVTGVLTQLNTGIAAAERVFEVLEWKDETPDKNRAPLKNCRGRVTIEDVSFSYVPEKPLIRNFSLDVPSGCHVAIVGPTGCGKTTLINLLMRFYEVNEGRILLDGTDIRDLRSADLRSMMGIVNQEPILFNDTIFNNIAFGVEGATEEQVIAAAKIANAHDFIMEKEDGYQTNIGDRGSKLSGGQRQRLSIARAILKNPPILILDEATASLDTESERMVQDALDKLMSSRTTIAIAHRLSTIKNADEIIVMHEGHIVERGRHEELIALGGYYKKLNDMQAL